MDYGRWRLSLWHSDARTSVAHRLSTIDHPPLTLGIETSGFGGSVALIEHGAVVAARNLDPTGRRHARALVPEIRSLLTDAGRPASDLGLIAVSMGPGSFTGLRVGVVCAKTLAWATGAAIIGVDTCLAIAAQSPAEVGRLEVVGDGQRGDLYVGRYVRTGEHRWLRDGVIEIRAAETWLSHLDPSTVATGPGLERHAEVAAARCRVLPRSFWTPQATVVARIGELQAQAGTTDDVWTIEPFYLRKSGAEEKADALATRSSSSRG